MARPPPSVAWRLGFASLQPGPTPRARTYVILNYMLYYSNVTLSYYVILCYNIQTIVHLSSTVCVRTSIYACVHLSVHAVQGYAISIRAKV